MSAPPLPPEVQAASADPGRRLRHYVLVTQVGSGGMGSVWKAWDTAVGRWVAVKFLSSPDETSVRRFQREAQMAGKLQHPNIAAIYEVGEDEGLHFLVMAFVDGGTIDKAGLPFRAMIETFAKVCRAVAYAHRNEVIHRDLKPGNIMLAKNGDPFVTDFGLAKASQPGSSISIAGGVVGTPAYMSPEQATGRTTDNRSDVYSLGATLYELAVGRPPFEAENTTALLYKVTFEDPAPLRKVSPQVPEAIERIVIKTLEKEPARRYATADELADDLERFLRDESVLARAPGAGRLLVKGLQRHPWSVTAILAFFLAGGIVAVLVSNWRPPPPPAPPPADTWRERFQGAQDRLSFAAFREPEEEVAKLARALLDEMPAAHAGYLRTWIDSQLDLLPPETWPMTEWMAQQKEARRIVAWCATWTALLTGRTSVERLEAAGARFAPVVAYRGAVSLTIYVTPYAEIRSLNSGEVAVKLPEDRHTPIVLREIDIAEYRLVLDHPSLGRKEFTILPDGLRHGGSYIYGGEMEDPTSFRLRSLP